MSRWFRLRTVIGIILKDMPRYVAALRNDNDAYLSICNRDERLEVAPDASGYRCLWQWTSDLHAPKYMPKLGLRLMRRALADHPFNFRSAPNQYGDKPDISFIIGHRGQNRLPHLLATLESIAGQAGAVVECIVVEQDFNSHIADKMPAWVRHVLTPPPAADMPYCRSWAFNLGAKMAKADVLVLHDNDMPVPSDYSACILEKVSEDFEVINLKRFIFYFDEDHTAEVFSHRNALLSKAPETIMQNSEGGGSIAITRKAYDEIGGFDESFIGWGGEDNEFWERAKTRKLWSYAFLPIVHLWHPAQPGKQQTNNQTLKHYQTLSAIPANARISALRDMQGGLETGPVGWRRNSEDK